MFNPGLRLYGLGGHRVTFLAKWLPLASPAQPWWATTNDSIDINSPTNDYGYTPGFGKSLTYSGGRYNFNTFTFGSAEWKGTTGLNHGLIYETAMTPSWSGFFNAGYQVGMSNGTVWGGLDTFAGFRVGNGSFGGNGNWFCSSAEAGVAINFDTGIALVSGTTYNLKFVINLAGTSLTWYINGTQVHQITNPANIPSTLVPIHMVIGSVVNINWNIGEVDVIVG